MHRVLVAFLVVLAAGQAHATDVAGSIGSNTTWNLAGSPYKLTSNAIVAAGVTLTIDPGVEVRGVAGAQLTINGTLSVAGTVGSPVVFREDASTWNGLSFADGSSAQLANVEIRKATTAIKIVSPEAVSYTFNGVVLKDFSSRGVDLSGTGTTAFTALDARTTTAAAFPVFSAGINLTLTNSTLLGGSTGINASNCSLTLDHTVVADATLGVSLTVSTAVTYALGIDHATFWSNPTAVQVARTNSSGRINLSINRSVFSENDLLVNDVGSYSSSLNVFTDNVWTGTKSSGTAFSSDSGNLNYAALLSDPAAGDWSPTERSPARYYAPADPNATAGAIAYSGKASPAGVHGFWYVNKTFAADSVTDVSGDMVITKGVTMTFLPGAQFRMKTGDAMAGGKDPARIEIRVEGTLEADGTNSHPVKFTSGAATAKPGDWYGIVIIPTTQAFNVSQVDIGYGYRGVTLESNDHIVAGSVIHDCSDSGIWVSGGTPNVESTELRNNVVGLYAESATGLDVVDVDVHDNTYQGVRLRNTTVIWQIGRIYNNGTYGVDSVKDTSVTASVTLRNLTIAHNGQVGVRMSRINSSGSLSLAVENCSITNNIGYGVTDEGSYSTAAACRASDIWGNAARTTVTFSPDTCFAENPLYVDAAARNYAPTMHSPLRYRGTNDDLVGAVDYGGVDGPLLEGWLWENFTFTKSGSPWPIVGDITVPKNVVVTFEPGAILQFVTNDGMGGGVDTGLSELAVLDGGRVVFDGGGAPILLTSAAVTPTPGAWYGLRLTNAATSVIDNAQIEYPKYGAYIVGPKAPYIEDTRFIRHHVAGIHAEGVSTSPTLDVLASWIVGDGTGIGIDLANSTARIRSSYVTHHSTGIAVVHSSAVRLPRQSPTTLSFTRPTAFS
ncbi:MAG: right-handed parallel beta-helix repeat-containing protein [Myxococcota bacterium]